MIGDMIALGIGTPSSVRAFILVGLSANPEVRDAEPLAVVGVYDRTLYVEGQYVPQLRIVATYDRTLPITGEV